MDALQLFKCNRAATDPIHSIALKTKTRRVSMAATKTLDYKKMYHVAFNALTQISDIAKKAQLETEEIYIEAEPAEVKLFPLNTSKKDEASSTP